MLWIGPLSGTMTVTEWDSPVHAYPRCKASPTAKSISCRPVTSESGYSSIGPATDNPLIVQVCGRSARCETLVASSGKSMLHTNQVRMVG